MTGFPRPGSGPVVVIGAGTAGSVVARRLVDAGYHVVLVEAGVAMTASSDERLADVDHLRAHAVDERWWPDVTARRTVGTEPVPYLLGRGIGGSSAVNGLMADLDPHDPALGPADEVEAAIRRLALPIERCEPDECGPLSRALLDAGIARPVELTRRDGRRVDAGTAYLGDLVRGGSSTAGRLDIVGDEPVDRIVTGHAGDATVVAVSGRRFAAAAIVVCAGAIHTPAILLRSGLGHPVGSESVVGDHLQDHPSIVLHVSYRTEAATAGGLVTGAVAVRDGIQLVPLDHLGDGDRSRGALLVALLTPAGAAGNVSLRSSDPAEPPVVEFRSDADDHDMHRLAAGVDWAREVLAAPSIAPVIERVTIDERGTPADDLGDMAAIERWVRASNGAHHHAAGSCGIGRCLDENGHLLGPWPVYVADASVFHRIPRTGTHLPTAVVAERLTHRWIS